MSILRATSLAAIALAAVAVPPATALRSGHPAPASMAAAQAAARQLAVSGSQLTNPLSSVDHFKCYRAKQVGSPVPTPTVTLADQFGARDQKVGKLIELCNPVTKIHDGVEYDVSHPELHLACFAIKQNNRHIVRVENQFGVRKLDAGGARELCLPSYKNQAGGPDLPPLGLLDHYKCYGAEELYGPSGTPAPGIPPQVTLIDQFWNGIARVGAPTMLCNPVRKTHDGTVTDVRYPDVHLVCFSIRQQQPLPPTSQLYNQFGWQTAVAGKAQHLCLPSRKTLIS